MPGPSDVGFAGVHGLWDRYRRGNDRKREWWER